MCGIWVPSVHDLWFPTFLEIAAMKHVLSIAPALLACGALSMTACTDVAEDGSDDATDAELQAGLDDGKADGGGGQ